MIEKSSDLLQAPVPDRDSVVTESEASFVDAIKFLYVRRVQLAVRFIVILGLGVIGFLYVYASSPKIVEGTVGLTFQGIERHEYPSGRKFTVEDFRAPDLLTRALADAGVQEMGNSLKTLAAQIFVTALVPSDLQARWRKQDKDGSRRDEYLPNEFRIAIGAPQLTDAQRMRLFDALVGRYREQVKYTQKSALSFVSPRDWSYEHLATVYDFWDLPSLFAASHKVLNAELKNVTVEASRFPDPRYSLAFRNISKDLDVWHAMRLQALEALTYHGRLVKSRESVTQRVQYRIEDIDIQIQQKTHDAEEQARLLTLIDRPKMLLGQLGNEKGLPVVDVTAIDRLLKSDYVGPVVARISELQADKQSLAAEKARLQKQLVWLPKASNVDINGLPSGYKELVGALSSELRGIMEAYNKALDEYLTAVVTAQISVKQSPIVTREGAPSRTVLAAIVCLSFFLAIVLMSVEHLYHRARDETRAARQPLATAK